MKQVIQDFKTGKLYVGEVPAPVIKSGYVLVRNRFSLISAGTERMTVSAARASLLGKARQRPDLVKMVIENLKKEGLSETLKKVKTKLSSLREMGYSSAGEVIASMDTNNYFKPGDKVACGGGWASHSELVLVPQNLVVKVPESIDLDVAAFTTVGAIALQGVRQADPKIGDLVCVIGLGLIGQITAQILKANGCQVFGIDVSEKMVEIATKMSCHAAFTRNHPGLDPEVDSFTGGNGFDSVIITASAKTNDPLILATRFLRKKGVMVLVGAVPIIVPRDPDFYGKELELKMSCSYGPGRYDRGYEETGIDYPYGYVRWTENRNMGAFLKLVEGGQVQLKPFITHVFDIDDAVKAYDLITGKEKGFYIGVLISYLKERQDLMNKTIPMAHEIAPAKGIKVGFIGAGSFAQKYLIPELKKKAKLISVVTAHSLTSRNVADKFGFERCSTEANDIFEDSKINTVFIATRHNSHADYLISAIKSGKHVFVEKPLALNYDQLNRIAEEYKNYSDRIIMVGFNRRFSPLAVEAFRLFSSLNQPKVINYRVNAGFIPPDHWINTEEGGGRIIGEVCHFVDFIQYVTNSFPKKVYAECINSSDKKTPSHDNVVITMYLADGSIGVITYTSIGSSRMGKERVEIYGGGNTFIINDFNEAEIYSRNKKKLKRPGKGHKEEIDAFITALEKGLPSPIDFKSIYYTTLTTFKIVDSLKTGIPMEISIL
ncbi:MAG: bi-domain-containing oxidoreductase [Candidatus Saccharicenans sp.]